MTHVYDPNSRHVIDANGETIAIVSDLPSADETHANGRLLAAAAEMLEALNFAIGYLESFNRHHNNDGIDWLAHKLQRVAAKAEGRRS